VFGDAEVKIRIGLSPNEQKGNIGSPELDQTGRTNIAAEKHPVIKISLYR
jgi:hypothetical protein